MKIALFDQTNEFQYSLMSEKAQLFSFDKKGEFLHFSKQIRTDLLILINQDVLRAELEGIVETLMEQGVHPHCIFVFEESIEIQSLRSWAKLGLSQFYSFGEVIREDNKAFERLINDFNSENNNFLGKINELCIQLFAESFEKNTVKVNMFILSIFILLRTPFEFKLKHLVEDINDKKNQQRFSNICKSLLAYDPHLSQYSIDHFRREIMKRMIENGLIENKSRKYAKTIEFFEKERIFKKYM